MRQYVWAEYVLHMRKGKQARNKHAAKLFSSILSSNWDAPSYLSFTVDKRFQSNLFAIDRFVLEIFIFLIKMVNKKNVRYQDTKRVVEEDSGMICFCNQ